MTLTLVIGAGERLSNGVPGELVLHRRGAVVGRATTCDWPLPDPTRHISSRHFEIRYDGHGYALLDTSTNGTFLASSGERLSGAHALAHGDRFKVGAFVIEARLSGEARPEAPAAEAPPSWQGWDAHAPSSPAAPAHGLDQASPSSHSDEGWAAAPASSGWGPAPAAPMVGNAGWMPHTAPSLARPEAHRAAAGWDHQPAPSRAPQSGGWAPDAATSPATPPAVSTWDSAAPARDEASAWSSAARDRPAAASPNDLWGQIAEGNVVDWARGGFGQPAAPPHNPLGLSQPAPAAALPPERPRAPEPISIPATTTPGGGIDAFLTAAGLDPASAPLDPQQPAGRKAGTLFRRLVAGLVVMVEARARAKAQLGAEATAYHPSGHNPLKFARTPDEAIAALLGPARAGFMDPEVAIEDAFRELQQHQVATLKAMQGALRATLERFSPTAIRARADAGGMLERIVPAARDAALWQAYEREFGGVALGSDEAFLDMFAKEFRRAYDEQAASNR